MRLHEQASSRRAKLEALEEQIVHFRQHLSGPKFVGTETVCNDCHTTSCPVNKHGVTACGSDTVTEEKDWISTSDVIRWLDDIRSLTQE